MFLRITPEATFSNRNPNAVQALDARPQSGQRSAAASEIMNRAPGFAMLKRAH